MAIEKPFLPIELESAFTGSIETQILNGLLSDEESREAFVEESIRTRLAAQIRAMRLHRPDPWNPKKFAEKLGKKTAWAYRLEDPNDAIPTIPSLLEVAKAFDVALDVRFVPFSRLLRETARLDEDSFDVKSFSEELPAMRGEVETDIIIGGLLTAGVPDVTHLRSHHAPRPVRKRGEVIVMSRRLNVRRERRARRLTAATKAR